MAEPEKTGLDRNDLFEMSRPTPRADGAGLNFNNPAVAASVAALAGPERAGCRRLPDGWAFDGEPHHVTDNEDCSGRAEPSYWRVWANRLDGRMTACGTGASPEAAKEAAVLHVLKIHEFESLPDRKRLWHYIDRVRKERGSFYQSELVDIVEIFARALLPREAK